MGETEYNEIVALVQALNAENIVIYLAYLRDIANNG